MHWMRRAPCQLAVAYVRLACMKAAVTLSRCSFHGTTQRGECRRPFVLAPRFARAKTDSERTEFRGAAGLRCVRIHVNARRDFKSDKAGSDDRRLKLCFQQSPGDSALP